MEDGEVSRRPSEARETALWLVQNQEKDHELQVGGDQLGSARTLRPTSQLSSSRKIPFGIQAAYDGTRGQWDLGWSSNDVARGLRRR